MKSGQSVLLAGAAAPSPGAPARTGMTLVEVLIVAVILVILALIVVPQYADASMDTKIAAAQEILHSVQVQIAAYYATNGSYPAVIEESWFAGGSLPDNPFDPDHPIGIRYTATGNPLKRHPGTKYVKATGSFWYNPDNGCFRAYVQRLSSNAETLALYNEVNGCRLTSFSQTS